MNGVFVFSDNQRIMSAEEDDTTHIWKAENGETLVTLTGPTTVLNMAPNSQTAISGDGSQT